MHSFLLIENFFRPSAVFLERQKEKIRRFFEIYFLKDGQLVRIFFCYYIAVSKENDIPQIAKKPIRDGRLVLPELENEFCWLTFHIKKSHLTLGRLKVRNGYLRIF
jgi:hypothetical protein